jgi:Helix-turn-helix domain
MRLPITSPADIPRDEIAAWLIALAARLLKPEQPPEPTPQAAADGGADEWLTAPEAAKLLRCSPKTLYRRARQMSCCRRNGRTLLFSKAGLAKWLGKQRA